MPAGSRASKAVQCFVDDEGVSLATTEFGASGDAYLFGSYGFEICVSNVRCPCVQSIELGKEDEKSESS